ncbi:Putative Mn2+ efflux pump MntP [Pelagirhabdus alkalitolerans]|uniref:Mn2+ efflux pump MntP n=1 Tax=Pelagirhabdus alkalitolerans TaxID=1612202 RepID=A0A1G6GJW3_9BACI|nr:manganese efflux pump [Pelagirhabdus alkalitolerans]SDB81476.1 Putative Mn2+ efflux pump MntP [Pelagirhabdus alkalitolerans]
MFYQFLLAIVLGLDAFSVCLAVGLNGFKIKQMVLMSGLIGFWHGLFPIVGFLCGQVIVYYVDDLIDLITGSLLVSLGVYLCLNSFTESVSIKWNKTKLIMMSLTVSLDSIPIGLTLVREPTAWIYSIGLFFTMTMMMSMLGLLLAKRLTVSLHRMSDRLGGVILIGLGLHILVTM